jgi:2-(1,2-epoxy-1,2-dihydrophenyl)acetyl-CoA isomerase
VLEAGLVDEVVRHEELTARAETVAQGLARGPMRAFGEMRRRFSSALETPLESQLELEAQALARSGATADAREGLSAFVQKRTPNFQGC